MEDNGGLLRYRGEGFDLHLDPRDPAGTANGNCDGPVDLAPLRIMESFGSPPRHRCGQFRQRWVPRNVTQTDQRARP